MINHFNLLKLAVSFAFFLSLVRATNIGLFLPASEFELGAIDYKAQTITNILLLLFIAAWLFLSNNYSFVKKFVSSPLIIIFIIGAIMSVVCSVDSLESFKYIIAVIVVTVPTVLYAETNGIKEVLKGLAWFSIVMAFLNLIYIFAFPQYAIMIDNHAGRWKGLFEHKNTFGPFFAISFLILFHHLHFSLSLRKMLRTILIILTLPICILFVIKSGSAAAIICLATLIVAYPVFLVSFRFLPMERFAVYLGLLSVCILLLSVFGEHINTLMLEYTGRDATLTGRTGVWHVLLQAVLESPVIGYGAGMATRGEFMEQFHMEVGWAVSSPHNSFIDLLLDYGILISFLIVYIIFKSFFFQILHLYKHKDDLYINALSASLMLATLANGFAASGALVSRSYWWIIIVTAIIVVHKSLKQNYDGLSEHAQSNRNIKTW